MNLVASLVCVLMFFILELLLRFESVHLKMFGMCSFGLMLGAMTFSIYYLAFFKSQNATIIGTMPH